MKHYNIAVLGPIPRDHITTHRGEIIEKYGAAMHTAIGLSRLLGNEGTVHMVSHVRKKDVAAIRAILADYPNIDTKYLSSEADQGDEIRLEFIDQNNRLEKQTAFMNPILGKDVEDLMDCDAFVCVPITDYEIPLQTLQYIKGNSKGVIIFDAHGPTSTVSISGDRSLRFWMDRDEWLPYIDVLKMNLEESNCCWFGGEHPTTIHTAFDEKDISHLPGFGKHVVENGAKALVVTLDEDGSVAYFREGEAVREAIMPSIRVEHVVDTTGCGDSFAGGLCFGLLEDSNDYVRAIRYANALGAQRTQGRSWDVFKSRTETNAMIAMQYGPEVNTPSS